MDKPFDIDAIETRARLNAKDPGEQDAAMLILALIGRIRSLETALVPFTHISFRSVEPDDFHVLDVGTHVANADRTDSVWRAQWITAGDIRRARALVGWEFAKEET